MMWPLAEAAWRVAGLPLPRYRRSRIPVRLVEPADEDGPPVFELFAFDICSSCLYKGES